MAIEYYQKTSPAKNAPGKSRVRFEYRAYGKEKDGRVPYADVEGAHNYARYAPTFGENMGIGDLSEDNMYHLLDKLQNKEWDSSLNIEEKMAHKALRIGLNVLGPHSEAKKNWARDQFKVNPHLQSDQLFVETRPATTEISVMFADPSMTSSAMTLAGMAYEQHGKAPIIADNDLSEHSSRLVNKAVNRGFPVQAHGDNPTAEPTNAFSLEPLTSSSNYRDYLNTLGYKSSSPQEVASGRHEVREMLRNQKVRSSKPVTDKGLSQQFLPGMEGFV